MSSIEQVVQQIENEIQINEQGQGKATIRAVARLADVDHTALIRAFKSSGELKPSALAQTLMNKGFSSGDQASWSDGGIPDVAIAVILKYYAYQAGRYCTEQARQFDDALSAMGLRVWMQQIKGWQKPQEPAIATTPAQMFLQVAQQLVEQERRQLEIEQRLAVFEQVQAEAQRELIALPAPSSEIPAETTDMKIRRVVNSYCSATGQVQGEVFRHLYQQFHYRYRRIVKQQSGESKLQAFVRMGLIDSLYDLAVELLANKRMAS